MKSTFPIRPAQQQKYRTEEHELLQASYQDTLHQKHVSTYYMKCNNIMANNITQHYKACNQRLPSQT